MHQQTTTPPQLQTTSPPYPQNKIMRHQQQQQRQEEEAAAKATEDSRFVFDAGKPPPFRIGDVRAAVPAHCWRKSPLRSLSYVARDVAVVAGLAVAAAALDTWALWPIYWAAQGTMFWALFVLGHDCGHGSFSDSATLNSVVGHLLHSFILVPYHGWRISHRTHHQNHGHIERDESWHPDHDLDGAEFAGRQQLISPVKGGEALPDLNERPANVEEFYRIQEAQGISLGNDGYFEVPEQELHEYGTHVADVEIVFDEEELEDSPNEEDEHANGSARTRSKDLSATQRQQIYEALLVRSNHGKLRRNATKIVAELFNVNRHAVWRIWRRVKQCRANGLPVDISSRKPKNSGRKKVEVDLSHIAAIPLCKRNTIRSLAKAAGIKKSTMHQLFKDGLLRRHSNTLKPYLKEENKKQRLRWCLSMLDQRTLQTEPKFIDMENIIHLDEKWYNGTKKDNTYYLLAQEEDPYRTVHNTNCIHKVMFLTAVTKPRYDNEGNCTFDGKIGIWPFVRKEPAQRRSGNRARGTLVTKTMKVDRDTIRSYMISKVLPAIVACWPKEDAGKTIWIQQDNARTHVLVNDEQFARAVAQTGLDIRLMNQPANSPDMNVLDLGFFASLQSFTYTTTSTNIDELIANVEKAYWDYDASNLRNVFLTLQGCLIEIMKAGGGNKYKIPHMNKERLEAMGSLPKSLNCDLQLIESVKESLGV